MGDYAVTIRSVREIASSETSLTVDHHIAGRAELDIGFTGGHLLHLAIAGCLFNDILREAKARSIPIDHLAVSATGDFDYSGSTGITYSIDIETTADRGAVERLVEDMESVATIPQVMREGTTVQRTELTIK